jgi:hypothetical protein
MKFYRKKEFLLLSRKVDIGLDTYFNNYFDYASETEFYCLVEVEFGKVGNFCWERRNETGEWKELFTVWKNGSLLEQFIH